MGFFIYFTFLFFFYFLKVLLEWINKTLFVWLLFFHPKNVSLFPNWRHVSKRKSWATINMLCPFGLFELYVTLQASKNTFSSFSGDKRANSSSRKDQFPEKQMTQTVDT